MQTITIYKNDVLPALEIELRDQDGTALDLGLLDHISLYMSPEDDPTNLIINGAEFVYTEPTKGKARYLWTAPDTEAAGTYLAEVVVVYSDNKQQTAGQFKVTVIPSLH